MAEFFLGEVRMFGFGFAPKYWAVCNGQQLSIQQNQALFSILGTTYGGNGVTTFALPDLRDRVPFGAGQDVTLGEVGGAASQTLTAAQLPPHTHATRARVVSSGGVGSPAAALWGSSPGSSYASGAPDVALAADCVATTGQGQAYDNRPPFLTVQFCIALQGIFPSRD
jgi:microcystin-dependent protein